MPMNAPAAIITVYEIIVETVAGSLRMGIVKPSEIPLNKRSNKPETTIVEPNNGARANQTHRFWISPYSSALGPSGQLIALPTLEHSKSNINVLLLNSVLFLLFFGVKSEFF